jgi:hypothetical protein
MTHVFPNTMRQAIETTFYGPTDFNGSRIVARCQARRITVPYRHAFSSDWNHATAASMLAERLGWTGNWYGGANANGRGYVFTLADNVPTFAIAEPVSTAA